MGKTDLEIAVDAIRYCRSELSKYRRVVANADAKSTIRTPSKATYDNWIYNIQRLEYILGERTECPTPPWYDKKNYKGE